LVWLDLIQDDHVIQAVFNRRAFAGSDQEFEKLAKNIHRGDIVRMYLYRLIDRLSIRDSKQRIDHSFFLFIAMLFFPRTNWICR